MAVNEQMPLPRLYLSTSLASQRQGIIPCGRCAFFVPNPHPQHAPLGVQETRTLGTCRARQPIFDNSRETYGWPFVDADPKKRHGCGEGLLREEAAPLPQEAKH